VTAHSNCVDVYLGFHYVAGMEAKPITGQAFFVLSALAEGPLSGHGIVGEVAELSQGRVQLKIGSLYGVLDRLAADGLIELDREEAPEGRLRRYYRLTQDGRRTPAGAGPRAAAVLANGAENAEPASCHRAGGAAEAEAAADGCAGSPVSSDLERRYRRVLRLLPGWYRKQREEDMVAAFLDSWLTGDPEADEYISEAAGPGWAETASVAGLAVRLHLGGGSGTVRAEPEAPPRAGVHRGEILFVLAVFAVLCVAVLRVAPVLVEPDDRAYLASIIGLTDGHLLTLSGTQAQALASQVQALSGRPFLIQWTQLANGRWISQKDPGYPFLAVPFQLLGIIRLAPLWYGLLGCTGLFVGARRWLGRFGGAAAVGLYCSSGAAIQFAWRDYMPTFTDASLIAAGTGLLLWAVLAADASLRRRTWAGVVAFAALGAATFTRYTDIVVLGCAVVAVIVARRLRQVPARALAWWLGTVVLCCTGIAVFNDLVYGGPLNSAYPPGLIEFSLSAIPLNLRYMPAHLIDSMPMLVLGLAGLAWIIVQAVRQRRAGAGPGSGAGATEAARRDLAVGLALAGSWATVWGLYAAYTWTALPGLSTLQAVRFYVPALAAISLLGAWLVTRLPRRESLLATACAVLVVPMLFMGLWSFHDTIQHVHELFQRPVPVRVGPAPVRVHFAPARVSPSGPGGQGGPSPSAPAGGPSS
jgi:PadR family transcriptional regulator, regulatory protein PadR